MSSEKNVWRSTTLVLAFLLAWAAIPPPRSASALPATGQDSIDMVVNTGAALAANVSYSANTSTQITGSLVNSTCYRVMCTTDVEYRYTNGTSTAIANDTPLPAKTVEKVCLPTTPVINNLTVIGAVAGNCTVSSLLSPN